MAPPPPGPLPTVTFKCDAGPRQPHSPRLHLCERPAGALSPCPLCPVPQHRKYHPVPLCGLHLRGIWGPHCISLHPTPPQRPPAGTTGTNGSPHRHLCPILYFSPVLRWNPRPHTCRASPLPLSSAPASGAPQDSHKSPSHKQMQTQEGALCLWLGLPVQHHDSRRHQGLQGHAPPPAWPPRYRLSSAASSLTILSKASSPCSLTLFP